MNSALFSFDYELFLGSNSGNVDSCMIRPTNRIKKILDAYKVKGIFFVDTIYLIRLKEMAGQFPKVAIDYENICLQLNQLHQKGHYLFIHLHPHWLDAQYESNTNTWNLSNTNRYRISSLLPAERDNLFRDSISLLDQILATNNPALYNGYRAGGWSITPFSDFSESFKKNNIKYDFTVITDKYLNSNIQQFDFRNAPRKILYRFEEDINKEDTAGNFVEIPVSVYSVSSSWHKISHQFEKMKHVISKWRNGNQEGLGSTVKANVIESDNIKGIDGRIKYVAQFENLNFILFVSLFGYFKKKHHIHTVSHPKMFKTWDYYYLRCFLFFTTYFGELVSDFKVLEVMLS